MVIRAKKNCVAYFEPDNASRQKRGPKPKYGEKVKLMELFDHPDIFKKVKCRVYGRLETVSITALNLLWKPTGMLICFVLARSSRGPIILMTTDLNAEPVSIFELYCLRTRIETMFDMLKNVLWVFNYRFWSKLMPRHSRKPKKNSDLIQPYEAAIKNVRSCWDAYERFVMVGAIALGLLQMLALKFKNNIWAQFNAYIRTRSRALPSEKTVKHVVAGIITKNLYNFAPHAIMRLIRKRFF